MSRRNERNRSRFRTGFLTALVLSSVIGCNSNDNVGEFPGEVEIESACRPPQHQLSLIYPMPNAANVPTSFSEIVVATPNTANGLSSYRPIVLNGSITDSAFSVFVPLANPSSIPTPYASPGFSGTAAYAVSVAPGVSFPSSSTLAVYLGGKGCSAQEELGSFTVGTSALVDSGQLYFTPYGGNSNPTLVSSTSPTAPNYYAAPQPAFQMTISEPNYSGKFTAFISYFSAPLNTSCYTVTMDPSGTVASFVPYTANSMGTVTCSAATVPAVTTTVEGALIEDSLGNSAILYFLP